MTDPPQLPEADLAALADGSLPAARQAELRVRVQASPQLAAALAEQEQAVSLLRALDQPAPAALRARVRELTGAVAPPAARRRHRLLFMPAATALAVVVVALIVAVQGGGRAPTVPQTARLALAAATEPTPPVDRGEPDRLSLVAAGIPFPYYERTLGWETAGRRTDTLGGRRIVTVFYRSANGTRVGYMIVSGSPLNPGQGREVTRGGVRFTLAHAGAATLVTWRRSGHTCVIAGRSVLESVLLTLAEADEQTA